MLTLREENELLREENRQLKQRLGLAPEEEFFHRARKVLGLTPRHARVLSVLTAAPQVKHLDILEAISGPEWEMRSESNVGVAILGLRKALTPHGIEVENVWGVGYRLTEGGRSRVRELLQIGEVA